MWWSEVKSWLKDDDSWMLCWFAGQPGVEQIPWQWSVPCRFTQFVTFLLSYPCLPQQCFIYLPSHLPWMSSASPVDLSWSYQVCNYNYNNVKAYDVWETIQTEQWLCTSCSRSVGLNLKNLHIQGEGCFNGNSLVCLNCSARFLTGNFWQANFEMFWFYSQ